MKKTKRISLIVLALMLLFSSSAFAAQVFPDGVNAQAPSPTMDVKNGIATCSVRLLYAGKSIDATLELKQGSTVVASWHDTGTGYLLISGTANVASGVTYTLTVSGTVNGVAFTPSSITVTP